MYQSGVNATVRGMPTASFLRVSGLINSPACRNIRRSSGQGRCNDGTPYLNPDAFATSPLTGQRSTFARGDCPESASQYSRTALDDRNIPHEQEVPALQAKRESLLPARNEHDESVEPDNAIHLGHDGRGLNVRQSLRGRRWPARSSWTSASSFNSRVERNTEPWTANGFQYSEGNQIVTVPIMHYAPIPAPRRCLLWCGVCILPIVVLTFVNPQKGARM